MYKVFLAVLNIVWVLDILDIPCMKFLDTTVPINTLAWFLIFMLIPSDKKRGVINGGKER